MNTSIHIFDPIIANLIFKMEYQNLIKLILFLNTIQYYTIKTSIVLN